MRTDRGVRWIAAAGAALFFAAWACDVRAGAVPDAKGKPPATEGTLRATGEKGEVLEFPLKHTSVNGEIAGFVARVEVTQRFHNPHSEKIEAVYVFPLPEDSAVDEMIMCVGTRTICGEIKKRREARIIYEEARAAGKRTALLDQERPNIFTQSVANIQPGEDVVITIRYVQRLRYDRCVYSFNFPMVVGPRFIPGTPMGDRGAGWAPDTDRVPDASHITPPVLKPGVRSGHDIALTLTLDPGLPVEGLRSLSHEIETKDLGGGKTEIRLEESDRIPNKDFLLEYRVAGERPRSAALAHRAQQGGYLLLMLQPSIAPAARPRDPKEIFFVVDTSGSMSGYPIQKVKEAMYWCIQGLGPDDTFQIVRFSSNASGFSPAPVAATPRHKEEALDYIQALAGEGGTMAIAGVRACLDYPRATGRQRIVFFMTDGFVGNENEILAEIKAKVGDARLFSFGVGSSPNRYFLEGMAAMGRGTARYIRQDQPAEPVIKEMLARVAQPYLTDVRVDWGGLAVTDVYPDRVPDLFSAQPLVLCGRFSKGGKGTVTLRGTVDGAPFEEKAEVSLPEWNPDNAGLAPLWAREKIKSLTLDSIGGKGVNIEEEVTRLALDYRLMSQYTSFVAVDEEIPAGSGTTLPRVIPIPVPMPEGVTFTGVFGPPSAYPGDYVEKLQDGMDAMSRGSAPMQAAGLCREEYARDAGGFDLAQALPGVRCKMAGLRRGPCTAACERKAVPTEVPARLKEAVECARRAETDASVRPEMQKKLIAILHREAAPRDACANAVRIVALKALVGYGGGDGYPVFRKIAEGPIRGDARVLALACLSEYPEAAPYLVAEVLSGDAFIDRPEMLAVVARNLKGKAPADRLRAEAWRLLHDGRVSAGSHEILRVALIEELLDGGKEADVSYCASLLRTDPSWKVRRTVLAGLAGREGAEALQAALGAISDPHAAVRQLALATAVAATAAPEKRSAYLKAIAENPTPAACDRVLSAEGLDADLALRSRGEIERVLKSRGARPV